MESGKSSSGGDREIDATLHLLATLERLNAHNPMAAEFQAMRQVWRLVYASRCCVVLTFVVAVCVRNMSSWYRKTSACGVVFRYG